MMLSLPTGPDSLCDIFQQAPVVVIVGKMDLRFYGFSDYAIKNICLVFKRIN
jgi:hypothetical protein